MFIIIELLCTTVSTDRVNIVVNTPKEALAIMRVLDASPEVIAFTSSHLPEEFGASSKYTEKLRRDGFTKEDFSKIYS